MKRSPATYWFMSLALASVVALDASAGDSSGNYATPKVGSSAALSRHHSPSPNPHPSPGLWLVINKNDAGPGSLRAAISNAAPGNTIKFSLKLPATIALSSELVIDKDVTILGPGPQKLTVARRSCPDSFRIFRVDSGDVLLSGMSIVNGAAHSGDTNIDNLGGGIYNEGSLIVSNCVITRNVALTEGNSFGFGAGIFTIGPLTVINSTISGNTASYAGGGISTFHCDQLIVDRSVIYGNLAGIQGGGLNFQGVNGSLKNTTISGNKTPASGTASAILNLTFSNEGSTLDLSDCTIARNTGNTNGAIVLAALPGNLGNTTRMIGTLVADNKAPNFFFDGDANLVSYGHNLDTDGTSEMVDGVAGDQSGTLASPINARISPLQDNGGPTRTHALLRGSPALNMGSTVDVNGAPITMDQRSKTRPVGFAADVGAFENQAPQVRCPSDRYVQACQDELCAIVSDPDGDPLTVVWIVDGSPYATNYVDGSHAPCSQGDCQKVSLSAGNHTIALSVTDGKSDPVECSTTVTAKDTKAPWIKSLKATPNVLSPANRQMVPVTVSVVAIDDCSAVTNKITSVRSDESTGNEADWIITGNLTVSLRAERSSSRNGRTYTITVQSKDATGNSSTGTVKVYVPGNDHH